ncbi:hypothetical protein PIB30_046224 [Stylosanthes scabra]|uniref:Uncharacterized protein n=1 Tax=Stylosanthes scabra TaxID=79078 RepID=A0ABU6SH25_9FABA|nr:hypothetical protein [Stylosanthes scabra]
MTATLIIFWSWPGLTDQPTWPELPPDSIQGVVFFIRTLHSAAVGKTISPHIAPPTCVAAALFIRRSASILRCCRLPSVVAPYLTPKKVSDSLMTLQSTNSMTAVSSSITGCGG